MIIIEFYTEGREEFYYKKKKKLGIHLGTLFLHPPPRLLLGSDSRTLSLLDCEQALA